MHHGDLISESSPGQALRGSLRMATAKAEMARKTLFQRLIRILAES